VAVCFTGNPAVDLTYRVPRLDDAVPADESTLRLGGKGVNLSRSLLTLGTPVHNVVFAAGHVGSLCQQLLRDEFADFTVYEARGETRINTSILVPGRDEVHIRGSGPRVEPASWSAMCREVVRLGEGPVCVCGRLPRGVSPDQLDELAAAVRDAGRELAVDSFDGEAARLLGASPYAAKPNLRELSAARQAGLTTERDITRVMRSVIAEGCRHLFVSAGAAGAYYGTADGLWQAGPVAERPGSSVGCGDAFFGGALNALSRGKAGGDVLRAAMAAGTAAVGADFPGRPDRERFQQLLERIPIQTLT